MFVRNERFQDYVKLYPVITTIAAIHTVLFAIGSIPFFPRQWLFHTLAGVNIYIDQGEYWRLVTPIFIHMDFSHYIFNTISLLLFGPPLEQMLGKRLFIALYLVCGISANLFTFLLLPLTYIHVGSSGAIFGLFGFYSAMVAARKITARQSVQLILPLVIIALFMTFIQPGVNVVGHIFGLLTGLVIGLLSMKKLHSFK
ncbi:rhomboid family intramembrane serine protease [Falsibacillus albus]|uniref:Rhomboid family intramembrane serine protease n=1 Tax=Falsibacillus albus TaxID=2478915 RepID=A0A3L7JQT0_9BACI|nr:rhomboid family intramembrane serine protease [Falsibacillus albus]RLQ93177.1 rhomboid family intramembrane serine protease [Falsibacillus albus]